MRVESSVNALQSPLRDKAVAPSKQQENASQEVASALGSANVQEIIRRGSIEAFDQADTFHQQARGDDNGTFSSQHAIDTYQSVSKEERRSEIQQMLGVDTFA